MASKTGVQMIGEVLVMPKTTMKSEQRLKILVDAPRDCWVAISEQESRIVAHGKEFSDVVRQAETFGFNDPLMIRIPKQWAPSCFKRASI
jgi:hypothetical protein